MNVKRNVNRKKIYIFLLFSFLLSSSAFSKGGEEVFHRSFWAPKYHGLDLNYCSLDNKECGIKIASRYCQLMGYKDADYQIIQHNVGLTNYILTSKSCRGWYCNGFKTIRCLSTFSEQPPKLWDYRLYAFVFPRYKHYRVDWCLDGAKHCGLPAANSFCRRMGYKYAKTYTIQKLIGVSMAIGNQKLCLGDKCSGFFKIICYR